MLSTLIRAITWADSSSPDCGKRGTDLHHGPGASCRPFALHGRFASWSVPLRVGREATTYQCHGSRVTSSSGQQPPFLSRISRSGGRLLIRCVIAELAFAFVQADVPVQLSKLDSASTDLRPGFDAAVSPVPYNSDRPPRRWLKADRPSDRRNEREATRTPTARSLSPRTVRS